MDTVCLLICNDFCICDTIQFPIQISGDTLNLPFFDDFSYDGPYPSELWLDRHAFVNNDWGFQPPSIGFVTMDGLDAGGTPYGNDYGKADYLTSAYLDLSSFSASDNLYLSFYAEPKGYGYEPNLEEGDSLVLEFKSIGGNWEQIASFEGLDNQTTGRRFIEFSVSLLSRKFKPISIQWFSVPLSQLCCTTWNG